MKVGRDIELVSRDLLLIGLVKWPKSVYFAIVFTQPKALIMKPLIRLDRIQYAEQAYISLSFDSGHNLLPHVQKIPSVTFLTPIKTWAVLGDHSTE